MKNTTEVINALGGVTTVASHLNVPAKTVYAWGDRNSIPIKYWLALMHLAGRKKLDLDYETLTLASKYGQPARNRKRSSHGS